MVNVGKYTSPMDPMGVDDWQRKDVMWVMLFQFVSQEFLMIDSIAYTSFNLSENLYNPSRVAVIAKQMTWSGTVEAFKTNLANEKPRKNTGTYLHS